MASHESVLEQLQGVLGTSHRVERVLRHGDATVCLAHDLRHGRTVEVTVLSPALAATLGTERFLHAMAAVGLISFVIGASGVRPIRKSSIVCAPATADFDSSTLDGRSSLWVYGMFNPMPPVPLVPIFT